MSVLVASFTAILMAVGGLTGAASAEDEQPSSTEQAPRAETNGSDGDGQADAPDAVSASVMAKITKKPVEDISQRTETDMVLAKPDGSWTSKSYLTPVRVMKDDKWVDVDYTLVKNADGSWAPKASPVDVTVDGGGASEAARVTFDDGQSVAVTWPEVLPEPTIDGGVATYKVSDSSDLIVTVTGAGLNAHIRLNEPPAAGDPVLEEGAFELGIRSDDLKVKESGGGLKLVDSDDGKTLGGVSKLVAWDSKVDDAGSPAEVVPLDATLGEPSQSGDVANQSLELKTPEGYLTDPNTQYPVIIDPSFTNLSRLRDTWVRSGDSTNYQSGNYLAMGKINGSSITTPARAFLKFHTGPLAGKQIIDAKLKLYQFYAYPGACSGRPMQVFGVTSAWDGNMVWGNQPAITGTGGVSFDASKGTSGCPDGWTTVGVKAIVQGWANGSIPNEGFRLNATDESKSAYERRFCSMDPQSGAGCGDWAKTPYMEVDYNTPPNKPQAPVVSGMQRSDGFWANSTTPTISTASTDQDQDPDDEAHYISVANEVNGSNSSSLAASCYTPWVESGQWAGCVTAPALVNGQAYWASALAHDAPAGSALVASGWSASTRFRVDATPPPAPTVTCTGPYGNSTWTETRTTESINCTATSSGAYEIIWNKNKSTTPTTAVGSSVTIPVSVPKTGSVALDFTARSKSGNTTPSTYSFGIGTASILPVEEERTTTTVPMQAQSAPGALSAKVQWRPAGSPDTAWVDAKKTGSEFDNVRVGSTNAKWTGAVQSSATVSTVDLVWSPNNEPNVSAPSHVESRVVFTYNNNLMKETPARSVQVLPHAFGGSFPSQDFGPGQVALFTGEFQLSETDIDVPAYSGSLTLGRSHLSLGGATTGPAGVFGPGWSADFSGPDYGVSGYTVDDRRALDGSIYMTAPSGESYGYGKDDGTVGASITGRFNGLGEYAVDEDFLTVNAAGTTLTMTEADGTVTGFTQVDGIWLVQEVVSAEANSTVTYAYTGTNVSWIFAPKPGGITSCTTTAQTAGCRALELIYNTENGKTRVSEVKLHIWDPKPDANGAQGAGASMESISVAKYSYTSDTERKLTAAWDPRLDTGGTSLKTAYTYDTVGGKTVVKTVTPPGLKAWTVNYDASGRVKTVTREHDDDVDTTADNATWTVKYGLGLSASGDGLPDLSATATEKWGQPVVDAPYGAAAVFGPDQVPDATPTAAQYEYANLSYWTKSGRTSNTAAYGAGAWQIDSTRYDDKGSPLWELSPVGKTKVLAERAAAPASQQARAAEIAASKYATLKVYTTGDERRVLASYGPMSLIQVQDTSAPAGVLEARKLTRTVYDDTAPTALKPEYPTTDVPVAGFGLPVETTERVTTGVFPYESDAAAPPTEYDIDTTQYRYDPVVAGDGNGWQLKSPTRVKVKTGASSWATTLTRFDTEGKIIETRTPQGTEISDGAGSDSRSTKTTYYTVGTNSADSLCGNKPQWAGLVCKTGPGGGSAPTTRVVGYSTLLAPTRSEATHDGVTRTDVTTYDVAGRTVSSGTTTSGLGTADRAVPAVTTTYAPTTGLVASATDGTKTQETTHDTWGRVRTATDGAGSTATTVYDAAGRVKTANDGKGISTYTYNGTDSRGKAERRGLVTSVDIGKPGGIGASTPSTFSGAYDEAGGLAEQIYPGNIKSTWVRDINGVEAGLSYRDASDNPLLSFVTTVDVDGRVITQSGPGSEQRFSYDKRDRLVQVKDNRAGQCTTRKYTFSGDSNRTALSTYGPGSAGACQTATGTTITSTFNGDDQLAGDVYDKLGRTTTLASGTAGTAIIGYHANDMVATIVQGAKKQDYTLDLAGRVSGVKNLTSAVSLVEATNHYDGGDDSPAWTEEKIRADASTSWTVGWERNVADLTGDLGLVQKSDGTTALQLASLHGDIAARYTLGATPTFTMASAVDEYGKPIGTPDGARYGWLGSKQRDATATAGLTLMGARLYNPATGRFLSRDPVRGGNDNTYTYPPDPVNMFDLMGRSNSAKCKKIEKKIVQQQDKLSRRARQFAENKKGFKKGDRNYNGHVEAFKNDQQGMRNALQEWMDCGCWKGGGLPKDAWKKATRPLGAAVAGTFSAWLALKVYSPACGPAVVICVIII